MTTTVKSAPTRIATSTPTSTEVTNADPVATPVVTNSGDETTDVKKPIASTTQTGARQRATSAEAAMRAKLDGQADAVAALKDHHPLAQGDDSAEVQPETQQLQQFLKDKGLYSGDVTGKFDAATDKAVRAFQQQNGLKVDGIVGQQTWGAVLGVKADPGINMLKPWAHSFTHASGGAGPVSTSPDGSTLRDKAKNMYGQPFLDKLDTVAGHLGVSPDSMLKIMNNESGLRTDAVNPHGGATGLIQFMPATAKGLGTTTDALKNMSATEQLDYVEKYYAPFKGQLHSATDLYTVTFYPAALGKPGDYVIGGNNAGLIARENSIFDIDGDGVITAQNFRDYCKRKFGE